MTKHHVTRLHDMVINLQPYTGLGEQSDEQHLAPFDPLAPQVIAVKLDQIEGIKEDMSILAAVAQPVEGRRAIPITGDRFTIDEKSACRTRLWQTSTCLAIPASRCNAVLLGSGKRWSRATR